MKCPRCQHENPLGARFCIECATPLAGACANCGAEFPTAAKFCPECAHPTGEPAGQPRFTPPESYIPKHLAEKILTSRAALEGERKQVTVLFADMKGSMELLADRDPEEARKILDPVLELMMRAIHRYEGTVNQVMGDGIMALFGAPIAHEDHAVRACCAAVHMQQVLREHAEEMRRTHGIGLQVRVGINSGEVVVRVISSDLTMDYTAVGATTHLAARMEQLATPGRTLITAATLRLAEGYVQVQPLGPVPVKGVGEPVEVFELGGVSAARRRFEAAAARGLARFVGRQTELAVLADALERAKGGHGQIVAPVGEPGVGKSRLLWEFTHSHRTGGCLMLEVGSVSYGQATAYLPIINLFKGYFHIQDRDDHREMHEKVCGKLLTLDRRLEPTLPAFLALLDVPVDDADWRVLDPPQRRRKTLDAVKRVILRESQVQPVVLVVEDLHWIDAETQAILDSLVDSVPSARVLLLVNYRPEYRPGWGARTYHTQLRIDPLPRESAEGLLDGLLGADPTLVPLKHILVARTGGNPFFLEECVRTLVEAGALTGQRGDHRLARPLADVTVPTTVHAMLAARIDRLDPEDKALLHTAAVVGRDVPHILLERVAGLDDEVLRERLARLQAGEFLYEARLFPDVEYAFKHALTHDVAYGSVLQDRRRELHGAVVDVLERLYPDRRAEHVEQLAHHAAAGKVWRKAVEYLGWAGTKASQRSAYQDAVRYFEEALDAASRLSETTDLLEQAIDLRFSLRTALVALGRLEEVVSCLREAEAAADRIGDRRRLGRVLCFLANCEQLLGRHAEALDAGHRADEIAASLGDRDLSALARLFLGQTHFRLGNLAKSEELLSEIVEALSADASRARTGMAGLPIVSRTFLAWCLTWQGKFARSGALSQEALQLAERFKATSSTIVAYLGTWSAAFHQGDHGRAVAVAEQAMALCRTGEFPLLEPIVTAQLGYACAFGGRVGDAVALLEEAERRYRAIAMRGGLSIPVRMLAEAYLLSDRAVEARVTAERAFELAREHHELGEEAEALRILGDTYRVTEPIDAGSAEASYARALPLAMRIGARPTAAHCHLGLGSLHRRTDKRRLALEHLTTATTMYREMGMTYWVEKAESEMWLGIDPTSRGDTSGSEVRTS